MSRPEQVPEHSGPARAAAPVRLDHVSLRADWRRRAGELSPRAGDRRQPGQISLLLGLPASAGGAASGAAGSVAQARLRDLHRQISWYGAGLLGCELCAAQLTGAGLAALPAHRLEGLIHHLFLAFSWQGDAPWTAQPGEASAGDLERRLARLGVRLVSGAAPPPPAEGSPPLPPSVLALGEGAEGLLWGRWSYRLTRCDEAVEAADQRSATQPSGGAPPRGLIEAWPHDPVRECRRHLIAALARGAVDPAELRRRFPPPVLQALEPALAALAGLAQLERSAEQWALCDPVPARRAAALLLLAESDALTAAEGPGGAPWELRPEAPRGSEIGLLLQAGRERIPVVVCQRLAGAEQAGAEGAFAFFYPEEVCWEREQPARRALRQLFQELFPAAVRRYRPASVAQLAERLLAATDRLAITGGGSGHPIPLSLSLAPRAAAADPQGSVVVRAAAAEAVAPSPAASPRAPLRFAPRGALGMKPSLIVSASNRCNLRCRFCLERGRRPAQLPDLAALLDALGAIDPEGISHVVFMSAETLLRRDVETLLAETRALGFRHICLATNGTLLRSRAQLDALMAAGLSGLELSVHTLDAERAAFLSGRSSTAERVRRSLALINEICAERPLGCFVNTVICQLNAQDVAPLVAIIERDYPAIRPRFVLKYPRYLDGFDGRLAPATLQQLRGSDIPALLEPRAGRHIEAVDFPLCTLTPHHAASMNLVSFAAGALCVDLKPGILPRAVYEKVLQGDDNVFAPECETCSARMLCCGVEPRYLEITGPAHGCQPLTGSPADILTEAVQASRYLAPAGSPVEAAGLAHVLELLSDCWEVRRASDRLVPRDEHRRGG